MIESRAQPGAKLDANESPMPPDSRLTAVLSAQLDAVNRYPEGIVRLLPQSLARLLPISPEQVVVGPGSAALCQAILLWRLMDAGPVHVSEPSYDGYAQLAGRLGLEVVRTPLREHQHDLERIGSQLVTGGRATVFLCNPNNPTGTFLPLPQIRRFVEGIPPDTLVVLDEAYVHYASMDPDRSLELIAEHDQVVVLRTFSKAYGLAGLRVGYGVANPLLAGRIQSCVLPYSVTRLAETAACFALSSGVDATQFDTTRRLRALMVTELQRMGFSVPDSASNFVWIALGDRTEAFTGNCRAHQVAVKAYRDRGVRVTVGSEREVRLFLAIAAEFPHTRSSDDRPGGRTP